MLLLQHQHLRRPVVPISHVERHAARLRLHVSELGLELFVDRRSDLVVHFASFGFVVVELDSERRSDSFRVARTLAY